MQTYLDCLTCLVRYGLDYTRLSIADPGEQQAAMLEVMDYLGSGMRLEDSPPWTSSRMMEIVRRRSGVADPYLEEKRLYNRLALALLDELRQRVAAAPDPFAAAARLAIAANIIDPSVGLVLNEAKVKSALDQALHLPLAIDHLALLRQAVPKARRILYLGDNAGEIVLDQLLVEQLPRERVTYAVRGRPVINDALMEDAVQTGMTRLVRVIDNGSDVPGTLLDHCSAPFVEAFHEADLVIAKGQGNYETMSGVIKRPGVFFLLKAKCPVVARELSVAPGSIVVKAGRNEPGLSE